MMESGSKGYRMGLELNIGMMGHVLLVNSKMATNVVVKWSGLIKMGRLTLLIMDSSLMIKCKDKASMKVQLNLIKVNGLPTKWKDMGSW